MTAPMTRVGLNVHACSTHAAAIDGETHRSCGPGPRISVATGVRLEPFAPSVGGTPDME